MKILLVQDTDWLIRNPHQQHHLMERLSALGHQIRVIDYEIMWRTQGKKELLSKKQVVEDHNKVIPEAKITVIRPPIVKIPVIDYISLLISHYQEINKQIIEFKPDIILGMSILNTWVAARLAKKYHIPLVYYWIDVLHTLIPFGIFQRLGLFIEKSNIRNSDTIIALNEGLRDYVISLGAPPENTYIIRAGIDHQRFNPEVRGDNIRELYNLRQDDIVLLFMGLLYSFSGLKEVAVELSRLKNEKIKLLLVGDGDLFEELKRIRDENDLQNQIILTGRQPYNKIPEFIAASDICMLPAYKNSIMRDIVPIKMYEYMAIGKPVIATNLSGLVKEFGYHNGVIYTDNQQEVLYKAIELKESKSLNQLGDKARNFVKELSWDKITKDFESILTKTVELKRKESR